jgi:hypothetical protein
MTNYRMPLNWLTRRTQKGISERDEIVLNVILNNKAPTPIMEVMKVLLQQGIGSMVSCHTSLMALEAKNFIKFVSGKDKRVKLCDITNKGKGYFDI